MALTTEFRSALAGLFQIDVAQVEVSNDGLNIAGTSLESPGDFDLLQLVESFTLVEAGSERATITSGSSTINFSRVMLREQPEFGVIDLNPNGNRLFLGKFGATVAEIDLSQCPEILLGVACLQPRTSAPAREWASILEAWGPFVALQGTAPEESMAEIGCFLSCNAPALPEFASPSRVRPFQVRHTTSPEALKAYVLGLQSIDGPDVAFLRLYRIFELEFAATLKDEMSTAALPEVYERLRSLHSVSELEILKRTIERSSVAISRFTCDDFRALFGSHEPSREQYKKIAKWLDTGAAVPNDCRGQLIYYIRCALVHSKFSETEKFLFGPFEGSRAEALRHVLSDMRDIIRDILAT